MRVTVGRFFCQASALPSLPEPTDRRTIRIQLTASGEAVINRAIPEVFEAQWARLEPLGAEVLSRLIEDLARFGDMMEDARGAAGDNPAT